MSAIARASRAGVTAFVDTLVAGLPDRVRFEVRKRRHLKLWSCLDLAPIGSPDRWRWSCPDADYPWHHAVDDQGFADTPDAAYSLAVAHWTEHHARWPTTPEESR